MDGIIRKCICFAQFGHRSPTLSARTVDFCQDLGIGATKPAAKSHVVV